MSWGFWRQVLNALANATIASQGLYGVPAWRAPPPTPSSGGWIGSFCNAASAVVTNPLGAFVSLVGFTYTSVVAATVEFDHLIHETLTIGGILLARTVATLKSIGEAILAALEKLLDWVLGLVEEAFVAVVTPFWNAMKSALGTVVDFEIVSENSVMRYVNGTGSIAAAIAGESLALAPLLAVALVITAMVDIVLGITLPLSIGVALVLGILISVVISVAGSGSVSAQGGGSLGSIEGGFSSIFAGTEATMVSAEQTVLNYTLSSILGSELTSTTVQPLPDPPDFVGTSGLVVAGTSLGIASYKTINTAGDLAAQVGFYVSVLSLALSLVTWLFESTEPNGANYQPNDVVDALLGMDIAAFVLGVGGMALDIKGLGADLPQNKGLAFAGLALDVTGIVTGAAGIATDVAAESTATGY